MNPKPEPISAEAAIQELARILAPNHSFCATSHLWSAPNRDPHRYYQAVISILPGLDGQGCQQWGSGYIDGEEEPDFRPVLEKFKATLAAHAAPALAEKGAK